MHRQPSPIRRISGVIALLTLNTGIVWSQGPPPVPQSPLPVNPTPVKGALVQLENGVRTYLRIEFPEPPSPALNPTSGDWTLKIFDTPGLAVPPAPLAPLRPTLAKSYLLTSSGWSQGTPGQFTYSGAGGAVTAEFDERTFLFKATGAEAMANVNVANQIGALLKIGGAEYYALIGGKISSNAAGDFKAHAGTIPVIWEPLATTQSITDIATGQPVTDAAKLANLQSALVFPDGGPGHKTRIEIALPDSCYSVEYLFSEIDPAVDNANPRQFLVTAEEVGVTNAPVNIRQQIGSSNSYFPGAYTASGPVRDGYFTTTFTQVEGAPIISGFIIQPLIGCTGIPNLTDTTPIVIDLGGETLPTGVYVYKIP
jgi:hypothetical protein